MNKNDLRDFIYTKYVHILILYYHDFFLFTNFELNILALCLYAW